MIFSITIDPSVSTNNNDNMTVNKVLNKKNDVVNPIERKTCVKNDPISHYLHSMWIKTELNKNLKKYKEIAETKLECCNCSSSSSSSNSSGGSCSGAEPSTSDFSSERNTPESSDESVPSVTSSLKSVSFTKSMLNVSSDEDDDDEDYDDDREKFADIVNRFDIDDVRNSYTRNTNDCFLYGYCTRTFKEDDDESGSSSDVSAKAFVKGVVNFYKRTAENSPYINTKDYGKENINNIYNKYSDNNESNWINYSAAFIAIKRFKVHQAAFNEDCQSKNDLLKVNRDNVKLIKSSNDLVKNKIKIFEQTGKSEDIVTIESQSNIINKSCFKPQIINILKKFECQKNNESIEKRDNVVVVSSEENCSIVAKPKPITNASSKNLVKDRIKIFEQVVHDQDTKKTNVETDSISSVEKIFGSSEVSFSSTTSSSLKSMQSSCNKISDDEENRRSFSTKNLIEKFENQKKKESSRSSSSSSLSSVDSLSKEKVKDKIKVFEHAIVKNTNKNNDKVKSMIKSYNFDLEEAKKSSSVVTDCVNKIEKPARGRSSRCSVGIENLINIYERQTKESNKNNEKIESSSSPKITDTRNNSGSSPSGYVKNMINTWQNRYQ